MKKIATSLLVALLMTAGLLTVTATSAQAVCTRYAGCVDTRTLASGPKVVAKNRRPTVCGQATSVGSTIKPFGSLRFTVTRNRGKYKFSKTVPYYGGKTCVRTRKVKKTGGYTLHVAFVPRNGSLFNSSSDSDGFDVVR